MEILNLSKFVSYSPMPQSNVQKVRIIEITEHPQAFNEQILCMDGELLFRRCLIKQEFESWKTSEKIIFQKKDIKLNWKKEDKKFDFQQTLE